MCTELQVFRGRPSGGREHRAPAAEKRRLARRSREADRLERRLHASLRDTRGRVVLSGVVRNCQELAQAGNAVGRGSDAENRENSSK